MDRLRPWPKVPANVLLPASDRGGALSLLTAYAALIASIALGVAGQMGFKSAMAQQVGFVRALFSPSLILGLAAYGLSTLFYLLALRRLPLSVANPGLAIGMVCTAILATVVWKERLDLLQWLAIAMIVLGVVVLNLRHQGA